MEVGSSFIITDFLFVLFFFIQFKYIYIYVK